MVEHLLEIALITYNRSDFLNRTLAQLSTSPFCNNKITVYDNNSSDNTADVCLRYQELFSNLHIVRHRKNIGGGANYLRAIELSTLRYTWIICDDDHYDFSDCNDVLNAITEEKCDLIWVSDQHLESWEKGLETTSYELLKRGARYYPALSFIPAVIFRTTLFDSDCLVGGYHNMDNLYPLFHFIHRSVCRNFSIYVARNPMVIRGLDSSGTGVSPFSQYVSWVKCCFSISDRYLRSRAIGDLTLQGGGFFKNLLIVVADEKIAPTFNRKRFWQNVILINLSYNLKQRLLFLILLSTALLLPCAFIRKIKEMRYRSRGETLREFDPRDIFYD
ncbi:MAG: glycosyltransferase family 2 protein [Desulfuromonadales bacterium]